MGAVRIGPDDIKIELPRALFGGLKKRATLSLLRQVESAYSELYVENQTLRTALEQLSPQPADAGGPPEPATSAQLAPARPAPPDRRSEHDELARVLLELAHRTSQQLRESTRRECELMIRKTRSHALRIVGDLEQRRATMEAELEELQALRDDLRVQMRSSLYLLLRGVGSDVPEWRAGLSRLLATDTDKATRKSTKHEKKRAKRPT
jgi:cell division septum initiation protein DivIVA